MTHFIVSLPFCSKDKTDFASSSSCEPVFEAVEKRSGLLAKFGLESRRSMYSVSETRFVSGPAHDDFGIVGGQICAGSFAAPPYLSRSC